MKSSGSWNPTYTPVFYSEAGKEITVRHRNYTNDVANFNVGGPNSTWLTYRNDFNLSRTNSYADENYKFFIYRVDRDGEVWGTAFNLRPEISEFCVATDSEGNVITLNSPTDTVDEVVEQVQDNVEETEAATEATEPATEAAEPAAEVVSETTEAVTEPATEMVATAAAEVETEPTEPIEPVAEASEPATEPTEPTEPTSGEA
jgi:hypothetical protein